MTSNRKILGRANIRVDGKFYDSEEGASLKVGGLKNNSRMTKTRANYNQTLIASEVKFSVPMTQGTSLKFWQELADAEVTFQSDTGQTWIIRNAAQTGDVETKDGADGGFFEVTLNGDPAEEMLT